MVRSLVLRRQDPMEALGRARRQLATGESLFKGFEQNIVFNISGKGVKNSAEVGKQLKALLKKHMINYDKVWIQEGSVLTEVH